MSGSLVAAVAVALVLANPLRAAAGAIVFDNGSPNGGTFGVVAGYLIADDFTFTNDVVLTQARIDGPVRTWLLLTSLGGLPNDLIATGTVTTRDADGFFDLGSIHLTGGQQYWLGATSGLLSDPCDSPSSWSTTSAHNGTSRPAVLSFPHRLPGDLAACRAQVALTGDTWLLGATHTEFWDLTNEPGVDNLSFQLAARSVPAPSMLTSFLVAFGCFALGVFRKRSFAVCPVEPLATRTR